MDIGLAFEQLPLWLLSEMNRPPGVPLRPQLGGKPIRIEEYSGAAKALSETISIQYGEHGLPVGAVKTAAAAGDEPLAKIEQYYDDQSRLTRTVLARRAAPSEAWARQEIFRFFNDCGQLIRREVREPNGEITEVTRWEWTHGLPVWRRLETGAGTWLEESRWQWTDGRLIRWEHHLPSDNPLWWVAFEWSEQGRLATERHSRDGASSYRYDEQGRLVERERLGADGSPVEATKFAFSNKGELTEESTNLRSWPRPSLLALRFHY